MNNLQEKYYGKKIDHMDILNIQDAKEWLNQRECIIVTGVTGQDGSHMVDFLLKNTNYVVFGCVRRLSVYNHKNISHINSDRFKLINFDLTDSNLTSRSIEALRPKYFINLAAQSFVGSSWDFALQTWETNSTSVLNILEAIRIHNPSCRLYQAGSSEEFGDVSYTPQDEAHPLRPRSPYGASKAASRHIIKVWRESYNLYAIQGWLFNHEGARRGEEFVTRKITKAVSKIKHATDNNKNFNPLELGNIDTKRDWSDAEDFVEGIWLMLNQTEPKEYVLSSNETHTIREFVELAFKAAGIIGYWSGSGIDETFNDVDTNNILMKINLKFYRPAEVDLLLGDSTKAREELGWKPKTSFKELVDKMVFHDILEHGQV
jgi:GDPmannose 4,6-dehydratase